MSDEENNGKLELLLIGTGTSSQVPSISCLTQPNINDSCECCRSTDKKNIRRNTSAILRIRKDNRASSSSSNLKTPELSDSDFNHILIDVGKSFYEASKDHFPKNKIRELSAVILTHPHADAINGLDDLRAWTLGGAIQKSIPIYCNEYTLSEITKSYSYLVDKSARTGGGDVPDFDWHVIEDGVPFEILGVKITPLPVHHGKFFGENPRPYICLAYLFDSSILYMSDVSRIPDSTFRSIFDSIYPRKSLPILIVDTLRIENHSSHFGIFEALETSKILKAQRTYLLGFAHRVSHDCWVHCCEAISRGDLPKNEIEELKEPQEKLARLGIEENFEWFTQKALRAIYNKNANHPKSFAGDNRNRKVWVRPGFDGLWLSVEGGISSDNYY